MRTGRRSHSSRPPAPRPRRLAQEAPPGTRKATVSAGLLLEGKAKLTGINVCAHCRPTPGLGLKLPQRSRLPEQEAGDQAEGQGRGLSQAHPARPGVAVSCGASGGWRPCAGM